MGTSRVSRGKNVRNPLEILRVGLIKGELDLGQEKATTTGLASGPRSKATLQKRINISMEKDVEGAEHEPGGQR